MDHVYWITEKLAGRCGPMVHPWNLEALYQAGFRAIVSLDDGVDARAIREKFAHLALYLPDVFLTTPELKERFLQAARIFVDFVTSQKVPVLVHCHAGKDRTGAMLACFLVSQGKSPQEAIADIRKKRLSAMTAPGYEEVVYQFSDTFGKANP